MENVTEKMQEELKIDPETAARYQKALGSAIVRDLENSAVVELVKNILIEREFITKEDLQNRLNYSTTTAIKRALDELDAEIFKLNNPAKPELAEGESEEQYNAYIKFYRDKLKEDRKFYLELLQNLYKEDEAAKEEVEELKPESVDTDETNGEVVDFPEVDENGPVETEKVGE